LGCLQLAGQAKAPPLTSLASPPPVFPLLRSEGA
jgi:hypothetical protein